MTRNDLDQIIALAKKAGRKILDIYEGEFSVELKDDTSPLTEADRASHEVIDAGLRDLYPTIPVLSEEGRDISYEDRSTWDRFWLVDPLDGTKEFIKRNGEFTVNIALVEAKSPVLGVIHVPVQNRTFFAMSSSGAWLQSHDNLTSLQTRELLGGERLTAVVSRSHPSSELDDYLKTLDIESTVSVGSSLKFCVIAEGKADIYPRFGPTMEWDTAAGQAILTCAGGSVRDLDGNELSYNKRNLRNGFFVARG